MSGKMILYFRDGERKEMDTNMLVEEGERLVFKLPKGFLIVPLSSLKYYIKGWLQ